MKKETSDLHGNAPDNSLVALLLVDVINDFDFPGGTQLLRQALPAAKRIVALKERCRRGGIPTIYVNDNFGKWVQISEISCPIVCRTACAGKRS